ncbi:tryptophan-rich antigen [Plakobranchus ocellatus]|uniref:Tryptophan-rich antigen n=1 Tax=Plakobranchus ocellatus TaxID=259542 RepID=A0AAV3ZPU6_9GAST|nr:tryptophan-rich antigen [Plakobranchus ocellatus]
MLEKPGYQRVISPDAESNKRHYIKLFPFSPERYLVIVSQAMRQTFQLLPGWEALAVTLVLKSMIAMISDKLQADRRRGGKASRQRDRKVGRRRGREAKRSAGGGAERSAGGGAENSTGRQRGGEAERPAGGGAEGRRGGMTEMPASGGAERWKGRQAEERMGK